MIVSKHLSNASTNELQQTEYTLDKAINDAESRISELKAEAIRLQRALRIFRANKADGVAWPVGMGEGPECDRKG
jgi:hypothetical protein